MPTVERSRRLIAVGGLSGTGKSTLARQLSATFPCAVLLRSDIERKLLLAIGETTRLDPDVYTPELTAQVYHTLLAKASAALEIGGLVVVDAVFARPAERNVIEAVALKANADFIGLWLETRLDIRAQRVVARRGDASDATADVVARQAGYDLGHLTWHRIDASSGREQTHAAAVAVLDAMIARPGR